MSGFIEGAIMMGNAVAALFFLSFWRRTRDRLLLAFSLSFGLTALLRLVQSIVRVPSEHAHYLYLIRLFAYGLIVYAIVYKNRSNARAPEGE